MNKIHKPRPAYLSELSMSALRPGDTVSGRANQMIERYLSMVAEDGVDVRATFTGEEWDALLAARPAIVRERSLAEMREGMAFALFERPVLQSVIRGFDGASFVVLVELLEREPIPTARRSREDGIEGPTGKEGPEGVPFSELAR